MAPRDLPHILIQRPADAEPYQRPPRRMEKRPIPVPASRTDHAAALSAALGATEEEGLRRRERRQITVEGGVEGIYVVCESFPNIDFALERLDRRQGKRHPEVRAVHEVLVDGEAVARATVFVPDGTLGYFLQRVSQYLDTASEDKPRHGELVDRINKIGLASLGELWTDAPTEFPAEEHLVWWEVWLRRRDGRETDRFRQFAAQSHVRLGRQTLGFADRTVLLMEATAGQLATALDVLDDLAELRKPRVPAEVLSPWGTVTLQPHTGAVRPRLAGEARHRAGGWQPCPLPRWDSL